MRKRPFTLTDLEDRALAACDDMYLETTIARNVLSTWYERVIPFRELRPAYRKLVNFRSIAHVCEAQWANYVGRDARVQNGRPLGPSYDQGS